MISFEKVQGSESIKEKLFEFMDCFPGLKNRIDNISEYSDKLSDNANVSVLQFDSDPVGIACFYDNDKNTFIGYISLIGIKSEYRKKGFGKVLMGHVLEESKANGMKTVRLEVDDRNRDAISFYKKYGFVTVGKARENSSYMQIEIL